MMWGRDGVVLVMSGGGGVGDGGVGDDGGGDGGGGDVGDGGGGGVDTCQALRYARHCSINSPLKD